MAFFGMNSAPGEVRVVDVDKHGERYLSLRLVGSSASLALSLHEGKRLVADLVRALWPKHEEPPVAQVHRLSDDRPSAGDAEGRSILVSPDGETELTRPMSEQDATAFAAALEQNRAMRTALHAIQAALTLPEAQRTAEGALARIECSHIGEAA